MKNQSTEDATNEEPRRIGLALSGGGLRAAIFHLGFLRFLSEQGLLGQVHYLSTVSGGSLITGLVFKSSGYTWPVDGGSFDCTALKVRNEILGTNLQRNYIFRLFNPLNWRHWFSRANLMAISIERVWAIKTPISGLPATPVWAINGTTMETGRRWRFRVDINKQTRAKGASMGDGLSGYWDASAFPLSHAMAASAAFPGGVTPLRIKVNSNAAARPYAAASQSLLGAMKNVSTWHIADGGVYDNLGLEPLFDSSKWQVRPESGCNFLFVSDAGAPLRLSRWSLRAQWFGFSSRTIDVMHAQGRNMRSRSFIGAVIEKRCNGLFLNIDESRAQAVAKYLKAGGEPKVAASLPASKLVDAAVEKARSYPTTLWRPNVEVFNMIEQHGYETAMTQWHLYG